MAHFEFLTVWRFQSPMKPIWDVIYDYEKWPSWWKGVEQVNVVSNGGPDHVGAKTKQIWKSALPYKLRFDIEIQRVDTMKEIDVLADGELRGTGTMAFSTQGDETSVHFVWKVDTTSTWMNIIAPIAAPIFRWNHGVIMNWGAECMAKKLGVKLIETRES